MQYNTNPYMANPYLPINGPSSALGQSAIPAQQMQLATGWQQPMSQPYQHQNGKLYVDGPAEAMSRLITMYPAGQLVPGFISTEAWDVNGRQFHVLSVEADGRRNLETFDYMPHVEPAKPQDYVTHAELEALLPKLMGESDGIHEPVQAAEPAPAATA